MLVPCHSFATKIIPIYIWKKKLPKHEFFKHGLGWVIFGGFFSILWFPLPPCLSWVSDVTVWELPPSWCGWDLLSLVNNSVMFSMSCWVVIRELTVCSNCSTLWSKPSFWCHLGMCDRGSLPYFCDVSGNRSYIQEIENYWTASRESSLQFLIHGLTLEWKGELVPTS